jgi:hypothetical protein
MLMKLTADSKSHCLHRLLWGIIMIGSTSLAVYSSLSIYFAWQEAPVLTTFGSDILPIHSLEFPSIILCSPGNNMAAWPIVCHLLREEWEEFWSKKDQRVLKTFDIMDAEDQKNLLTQFVRHHIPGWPKELTLDNFMLHMTTHFPALRRTLLLWAKEPEFRNNSVPVFDLLLNPARQVDLEIELEKIDKKAHDLFQDMDFSNQRNQVSISSTFYVRIFCANVVFTTYT